MAEKLVPEKSLEEQFPLLAAGNARVAEAWKKSGKAPYPPKPKEKKIIGLSCGKKNGNCETYLRAAAAGAEELGIKMEIIRAIDLKIEPCRGCTQCTQIFTKGNLDVCPVKHDDVPWIMEKAVLEDSALIVSAPVYYLRTNAIFMAINERMHPTMYSHLGILKKNKVGGIISVAGGQHGWAALGLTMMNIWMQHFVTLVDQVQVEMRDRQKDWAARSMDLGRNIAKAMLMPIEKVKYVGPESPVSCPVCHCDILQVPQNLPNVYCPVCWVKGVVSNENGKMSVKWDEWDVKHARFSEYGVWDHLEVILKVVANIDPAIAKERFKKFSVYGKMIEPPKS